MKIFKKLSVMLCFVLAVVALTACSGSEKKLVLTANKLEASRNEQVILSAFFEKDKNKEAAENAEFDIILGEEFATIEGNILTVASDAENDAVIKVVATADDKVSNEVQIVVDVPLETITISANDVTNIMPGNSIILRKTFGPIGAEAKNFEWVITEGETFCAISGDVLVVNSNVLIGSVIKVKAVSGEIESNELTFTVGIPVTKVEIKPIGSAQVLQGGTVGLSATITPYNATDKEIIWIITEGEEHAQMVDNTLVVNNNAPTGAKIKVKAVCSYIESNEVTLTVGVPVESISIKTIGSDKALQGSTISLSATVTPENATDNNIVWTITEGKDYAEIVENTLVVNNDAPTGVVVKVKAVSGSIESNELSFTIGIPVETVVIKAIGSTQVLQGNTVGLSATVTPANATNINIAWTITEGNDYAEIVDNTLVVNADAPTGAIVKVKASNGSIQSNELVFTIGIPVETVVIKAISDSLGIVKGNSVGLSATVTPANATDVNIVWTITEGNDYAQIVDNSLVVKSTAPTSAEIKVKAMNGTIESNELVFTVMPTQEEINASKYILSLSADELTIDKNGTSSPVLSTSIYNLNGEVVTNANVVFTIVEGEQYLEINASGYNCSFTPKGHGTAVVEASIVGSDAKQRTTINVIVPPEAINIPEVFMQRPGYVYNFSMVDPNTSSAETLPFIGTVIGENVCQDVKYTFTHEDGTSGESVAVWNDGNITFKKTGKVTVNVSSNSGSKVETTSSYVFNINEGYNVNNFVELKTLMSSSKYNGQIVNITVFEKPDGSANNYEYGYDLVPPMALKAKADQVFTAVDFNYTRITVVNKSVHINGNFHKIDASQLRPVTKAEIDADNASGGGFAYVPGILSIVPWHSNPDVQLYNTHFANIYDLELIGNCPIDFTTDAMNKHKPYGIINNGLSIGDANYNSVYYIDVKNITVSACYNGIDFSRVVGNGVAENIYVYNNYSNGIEAYSSIMTLKNVKFGVNGAAGIELAPDYSNGAGVNFDENQQITFAGTFISENYNNGATEYFTHYDISGFTVPDIINSTLAELSENQASHLQTADGEFNFISFIFSNFSTFQGNTSKVIYPAYQNGGIINATELPTEGKDETHQYIELDITVGGFYAGKALLYNVNYKG